MLLLLSSQHKYIMACWWDQENENRSLIHSLLLRTLVPLRAGPHEALRAHARELAR